MYCPDQLSVLASQNINCWHPSMGTVMVWGSIVSYTVSCATTFWSGPG